MIAQRGGFAEKNLWVTPHSDVECFPSSMAYNVLLLLKWLSMACQSRMRQHGNLVYVSFDSTSFSPLCFCLQVITR
jgi:hypothetical protein